MKKTFLARRNALFTFTGLSWGSGLLALACLALVVRALAPNFFWQVTTPAFTTSRLLGDTAHAFFARFNDAAGLTIKNDQLAKDNTTLVSENLRLQQQVTDLGALVDAHGSLRVANGIFAEVVARPPQSAYDTLVLAQGTRSGVTRGMEVFGPSNVPIGIIDTTSGDYARVTLFSAPKLTTQGWVGITHAPVMIVGGGGGLLSATLPRAANVVEGDTVFIGGPGMLPVGTVARVDGEATSPSVTLRITPLVNIFSLSAVLVRESGLDASGLFEATSTQL